MRFFAFFLTNCNREGRSEMKDERGERKEERGKRREER
jgi:hypothetical protein